MPFLVFSKFLRAENECDRACVRLTTRPSDHPAKGEKSGLPVPGLERPE